MKKLLCVIFALALVVATLTPVALVSAASTVSIAAEADEDTIKVGEKVIVTFSLDESANVAGVKSGNVVMTFGDAFEAVKSDDTCWLLKNMDMSKYDFDTNKGAFAFSANKEVKKTADVFSIELKALKTATSADITADFEFKTINGSSEEVTLGTGSATATVTVQSATCPHTNTEIKYSETEHWTYCKDCQTEVSGTRESHKGGTATCVDKAICEVCDQEYGDFGKCDFTAEVVDSSYLRSEATCQAYATYWKSCSVCGDASFSEYFEDTSGYGDHNFETTAWTTDGTTHWHKCLVDGCTAKDSEEACSYSEQHNETQHWDECDTCHFQKSAETHEYGGWITTDADKHWKECGCGVKALEANHVYDNDCDTTCNTCGHTRTITHSYDETTWKTSATQHWHECTVCHDKKDIENHGWSEEVLQDGSNLKQAADCTNAAQYWKVCEDCGKISTTEYFSSGQPADHSYTAKVISGDYFRSEKTCTAYATYYYKCTGCTGHSTTQYWEDEDGGYAQHNFSAETVAEKYLISPADCQHYAKYYKSCTVCGEASETDTFNYEEGGYGNHNIDTANWTSDGTTHWHKCLVEGCTHKDSEVSCSYSKQYSEGGTQHWDECATCHNKKNYENHEYGNWVTTDATKHWKECGCGVKSLEANHEYDNDCDTTCNVCGHTRQITHDYDTTTWKSDDTQHWHECTCCKDKTDVDTHSYDNLKLDDGSNLKSPATCTKYAVYYKVCGACLRIDYNSTWQDVEGGYAQHVYEQTWTSNGISHWHKCSNPSCDSTSDSALCSNSVKYNDTQHWTECDVCHNKQDYEGHSYNNWTATETEHYKECECGHKILEGEHTFVTNYDDNDHWTECSECNYEQVGSREAHTYREIILAGGMNLKTPATSTTPAEYYKVCECGRVSTETFFEKDYKITQGDNSKWEGTGELSFRSDADFDKFIAVFVDDEIVDSSCYTAKSGSTVITFTEEYLKTLEAGDHTVVITSMDGDAEGKFTVAKKQSDDPGTGGTPGGTSTGTTQKTGDNSSALLWIMITIAAAIAMTVVFVAPRKKER